MGLLEAIEHFLGQSFTPKRTIYLAFSHDEEVGGWNGAAKIAALVEGRGVRLGGPPKVIDAISRFERPLLGCHLNRSMQHMR